MFQSFSIRELKKEILRTRQLYIIGNGDATRISSEVSRRVAIVNGTKRMDEIIGENINLDNVTCIVLDEDSWVQCKSQSKFPASLVLSVIQSNRAVGWNSTWIQSTLLDGKKIRLAGKDGDAGDTVKRMISQNNGIPIDGGEETADYIVVVGGALSDPEQVLTVLWARVLGTPRVYSDQEFLRGINLGETDVCESTQAVFGYSVKKELFKFMKVCNKGDENAVTSAGGAAAQNPSVNGTSLTFERNLDSRDAVFVRCHSSLCLKYEWLQKVLANQLANPREFVIKRIQLNPPEEVEQLQGYDVRTTHENPKTRKRMTDLCNKLHANVVELPDGVIDVEYCSLFGAPASTDGVHQRTLVCLKQTKRVGVHTCSTWHFPKSFQPEGDIRLIGLTVYIAVESKEERDAVKEIVSEAGGIIPYSLPSSASELKLDLNNTILFWDGVLEQACILKLATHGFRILDSKSLLDSKTKLILRDHVPLHQATPGSTSQVMAPTGEPEIEPASTVPSPKTTKRSISIDEPFISPKRHRPSSPDWMRTEIGSEIANMASDYLRIIGYKKNFINQAPPKLLSLESENNDKFFCSYTDFIQPTPEECSSLLSGCVITDKKANEDANDLLCLLRRLLAKVGFHHPVIVTRGNDTTILVNGGQRMIESCWLKKRDLAGSNVELTFGIWTSLIDAVLEQPDKPICFHAIKTLFCCNGDLQKCFCQLMRKDFSFLEFSGSFSHADSGIGINYCHPIVVRVGDNGQLEYASIMSGRVVTGALNSSIKPDIAKWSIAVDAHEEYVMRKSPLPLVKCEHCKVGKSACYVEITDCSYECITVGCKNVPKFIVVSDETL